jgi:hypothetical protein
MEVQIKRFDLHSLTKSPIIHLVGLRGSGKTMILKDIVYSQNKFYHKILAMTPLIDSRRDMQSYLCKFGEKVEFYENFDEEALKELNSEMANLSRQEDGESETLADTPKPEALLILDECLYGTRKGSIESKELIRLCMNNRHYRITCVCLWQYLPVLPPQIQMNHDYIFYSPTASTHHLYEFWKQFGGRFLKLKYEDFYKVVASIITHHTFMVFDLTAPSNKICDTVFYFQPSLWPKPQPPQKSILGWLASWIW